MPFLNGDFSVYYARALRAQEFFVRTGRLWGYDPYSMAGYVSGPVCEAGDLFINLIAHWFARAIPIWASVLSLEIGVLLFAPFTVLWAIRLWTRDWDAGWCGFSATILTFGLFEPFSRHILQFGCFGFEIAVFLGFPLVALYREWVRNKRWLDWAQFTVLSCIIYQIHPMALLVIFLPLLAIFFSSLRRLSLLQHAAFCASALLTILANWWWLRPSLAFSHWRVDVPYLLTLGWNFFLEDAFVLGPLKPLLIVVNGAALFFAFLTLFRRWRVSKGECLTLVVWLGALFVLGLFGDRFPGGRALQMGRFVFPFWMFCYGLASISFLEKARSSGVLRGGAASVVLAVVLATLIRPSIWAGPFTNQFHPGESAFLEYAAKLRPLPGRILAECVDNWDDEKTVDLMDPAVPQSVIGGGHASIVLITRTTLFSGQYFSGELTLNDPLLFQHRLKDLSDAELRSYFDLYNIVLVACRTIQSAILINRHHHLVRYQKQVGRYYIFEVNRTPSWFIKGSGALSMDYDRLKISRASQGDLLLKFHWIPQLRSRPELSLYPVYEKDDPVPFVGIHNRAGDKKIEIYNAGL